MRPNKEALPRCVETCHDDAQLIEQFQGGDESVFDEFVRRYQERIYRLARRFVKNREDALDITPDAFIKAYQGLSNFKRASQFYTWLYRITVNLCIDFLRKNASREMMTIYESQSDDYPLMNIADSNLTLPSKLAENKELSAYLRKAISQLSVKQREVFILRHWEGLSLKEIAHTVGRSVGTVKAHLFYAHRNLQNSLRPYLQVEQSGDSNS